MVLISFYWTFLCALFGRARAGEFSEAAVRVVAEGTRIVALRHANNYLDTKIEMYLIVWDSSSSI